MTVSLRLTIAAAVATFLASLALVPTHDDGRWLLIGTGTIILVALVGHGLRVLRTPRLLIPPAQLVGLLWIFLLGYARGEMHYGVLPSSDALAVFGADIQAGMAVVVRYSAPLPYDANATLITALGIGLVAVVVDALAVTARLVPWAGLPLLLLYSIPATTVTDGLSILAFVPAAIGYVALLMAESRTRIGHWGRVIGVTDRVNEGYDDPAGSILGRTGRRVGVAAICAAVIVPALLPELPDGLMIRRGQGNGFGSGGQTIRIDNPIVNIRRDLRLPENFELMTYETETSTPEYLRLAVLDEFDGEQWRPSSRDVPRDNQVTEGMPRPPGLSDDAKRTRVSSRFEITDALRSKRLPLPYPSTQVDVDGDWRYDRDTLDVVVGPDADSDATAGLEYVATSLDIKLDAEALNRVPAPPDELRERYTQLPDDIPDAVVDLARDTVGDATSAYAQAVALQNWFRSDFTYSTEPQPGHGGSHLMEFLEDRVGYCEQFSATMAIMARALGIPARVAVGYMPGTSMGDSTWVVRVHDAHAWPELYFEGYGWIRFEPTPSQQTGSAPSWTQFPADSEPAPELGTTSPETQPGATGATPLPEDMGAFPGMEPGDPGAFAPGDENAVRPWPFLVAGAVLLVLAAPALIRPMVRRARRSPRHDPHALAEGTWRELADTVRDLGLPWDSAATPRVAAAGLASHLPTRDQQSALHAVVQALERARYSRTPGNPDGLVASLDVVRRELRTSVSRRRRLVALVAPLSVLAKATRVWPGLLWLLDGFDALTRRLTRRVLHRRTA